MKYLIIFLLLISCKNSSDKDDRLIKFLETNYNFLAENTIGNYSFLKIRTLEYSKNIDKARMLKLDDLYQNKIQKIDSLFNSSISNKELFSEYKNITEELNYILDNKNIESIETESDLNSLEGKISAKTEILIAFNKAVHYLNDMRGIFCGVSFGLASEEIEIECISKENSKKEIVFSNSYLQKNYKKIEVIIDELKKNNSIIGRNIRYRHNNYSFASMRIDSLKKGKYQLKGKVRNYLDSGHQDFPIDYNFEIE